jgi:hypothetical protein
MQETGATLLMAKLDRLSRSVPFLRSLADGSVRVAFCDMPQLAPRAMGRFILTQMAAVAELEAGLISERTRAALKAAKARGVKLGGDRGYRGGTPPDASQGAAAASLARNYQGDALQGCHGSDCEGPTGPGLELPGYRPAAGSGWRAVPVRSGVESYGSPGGPPAAFDADVASGRVEFEVNPG